MFEALTLSGSFLISSACSNLEEEDISKRLGRGGELLTHLSGLFCNLVNGERQTLNAYILEIS